MWTPRYLKQLTLSTPLISGDQVCHHCVIRKPQYGVGVAFGHTFRGVEGVQKGTGRPQC